MKLKTFFDDVNFKDLVDFCMRYLKINPDHVNILEIYADDLMKDNGRCYPPNPSNDFMILLRTHNRSVTDIFTTLCHEMVHVKQFLYQDLQTAMAKQTKPRIPYRESWWEKEAWTKQDELLSAFVAEIKAR